ncbi:ABC transporter permease [Rhodobacter veldkampii DSM 11550]|uniref:ABC transporter permease n=1 Tax=Phaeovulum veldkampii DSM 11550 TaxID=1185920 RepID=A0A2T4JN95_9RHOB|nr:efflux RND transporter permease subunit [Phaeovulum veldkampii]MBK5947665.1 ABC transporter permease [Phaeovulum veldkampii DSM 11550]PTE19333.1 ABC transporter permease [Phaeovulum veldkampii DSM 11550]TDQ62171.1 multidrug efflux pump subunit AcrB [Phaeovulum veldkampii DSM 11550]
MNFSAWSIRNPIAPILAFVMLMVLGWQSFTSLPITRFPNIDVPLVAVSVAQSGAAPAEMETQITKEIEDAVAGITGVKNIVSSVVDGMSTTAVEFRMEVPTDKAVQDVKDAIDQIRGDLPGDIEAPIVTRIDVEGQAIMTFAVSAPALSIAELSWFVDDTIIRALQGRPGIGRVDRYGGADREILVELDPVRLDSFGITAAAVNAQLRATNTDLGAGRTELGLAEQAIRTLGDAATADRLAATTIALPSGRFVRLSDLGRVTDTHEELRSFSRYDGEQVVSFAVFRAKGASEVSVAETVNATLDTLRKANPEVAITLVDETVFYTLGNYEAALHTLLEGALLAVLVVLAFLKNWRATAIAAVALPLSAVPTFFLMDLLGFSLNLVSLLAITLATGILVDDAIVEIENIARHIRMGKTPFRAAIEAADEIGLAVIATSMTIVAVFVPVSFMPGIPGQYFSQFGLTVAISVIFSLLVARLITPMMAAYLMRDADAEEEHGRDGPVMRFYLRLVQVSTRLRYVTLAVAIGVLAVSLFYMMRIPGSFMPSEDVSRIPISVELPPGASLDETARTTRAIETAIADIEGVANIFTQGGASPTGERDVRRASVTVLLDKLDHSLLRRVAEIGQSIPVLGALVPEVASTGRMRPQDQIEAEVFARLRAIPDVRAFKLNDRGQRDISFSVLSSNEADLNLAVARLETALRGEPLLAEVSSEGALPRPEVQITPRADVAARLGITAAQIAQTVRVATIGDTDAALAKLAIDNRLVPVRVRLAETARDDLARLGALRLATAQGGTVPLSAVADIAIAEGPSMVDRLNRERRATIGANLPVGVALGTATDRFKEITASVDLPASVRLAEAGDAEVQAELMTSFARAMILGLMLVLTVLILLFGSVIQPFTILFSLPLAIGGVAAALILTGNAVSMPVLIGILMLMGIVTKNAILLVDFAIERMQQGLGRMEAVLDAGHKRARPIVMTSIAMSAGMLPSALGVGEGGPFRAPMAIAVIGGIIVSTVLSLVVVPSFFLIMDDLSRLLARIFGRLVGKGEAEPATTDPLANDIAALEGRVFELEQPQHPPAPRHVAE